MRLKPQPCQSEKFRAFSHPGNAIQGTAIRIPHHRHWCNEPIVGNLSSFMWFFLRFALASSSPVINEATCPSWNYLRDPSPSTDVSCHLWEATVNYWLQFLRRRHNTNFTKTCLIYSLDFHPSNGGAAFVVDLIKWWFYCYFSCNSHCFRKTIRLWWMSGGLSSDGAGGEIEKSNKRKKMLF